MAAPPRFSRHRKQRYVYDADHGQTLPGRLVATERRQASRDVEVREAFQGAGAAHDFFARFFGRNSIDGRGMPLISTVHYGQQFNNAIWNGSQLIFGDGDGELFSGFTSAKDVIGHEWTHGMTQSTAALECHGQPGALNEHIADTFGIMIKQYWLAQTVAQSDWLIGAGLFGPTVQGLAIRSMKAPGTAYDDPVLGRDPQPAHMRDYVQSGDDDGAVHINSGILNHAFYRAATGLGGYAWMVAGPIWYVVVEKRLFPQAGFQYFADATVTVAGELFGKGGIVQTTVEEAWSGVGLGGSPGAFEPGQGSGGTVLPPSFPPSVN